jgi:indole-3-glycerol phosphate synthase
LVALAGGRTPPALMVCESGIRTGADVKAMTAVGYQAFLVGESLATAPSPADAVRGLIGSSS